MCVFLMRLFEGPPPPPNVTEIIPTRGPTAGGTRAVILGSNFFGSPSLRMKFGDVVVCSFYPYSF